MDAHREHMRNYAKTLHGTTSSLLSDDRYDEIMQHLKNPDSRVSSSFKHWVKKKGFAIMDLSALGGHEVMVIPGKATTAVSKYLRVVSERDIYDVTQQVHQDLFKHTGYKKVLRHITERYYGITRGYIQAFTNSCPTCKLAKPQKTRPPPKLNLVLEKDFLARVEVDIVDMRQCPDGDYNYICHVEDHFTKFHVLFPLRSNSAQEVAIGLEQRVLAYFGPPRILHTDSGPEFSNALLQTLYRQWNADITFLKGRTTLVEQGNQMLQRKLAAIKQDLKLLPHEPFQWATYLPHIMWAMNTEFCETTNATPYRLVFGQEPHGAAAGPAVVGEEEEVATDECLEWTTETEPTPPQQPVASSSDDLTAQAILALLSADEAAADRVADDCTQARKRAYECSVQHAERMTRDYNSKKTAVDFDVDDTITDADERTSNAS